MDEPTQLDGRRGSPPRSDAAERGRYADEDPLTFLDQVAGSLEESAAGRGVSSYRPTRFEAPSTARNQLVRLYRPSRRPTSTGSHLHRIRLSYRTERSSSTCKKLWRCSCRGSLQREPRQIRLDR